MKHINNGFAYLTTEDGKIYSVSWQVEVTLEGVKVTYYTKKEVRYPDPFEGIVEARDGS